MNVSIIPRRRRLRKSNHMPALRYHLLVDWLLALGMLMALETQLRSESSIAGPGEILLAAWLGLLLLGEQIRPSMRLGKVTLEIAAFWSIFAFALCLGTMQSIVSATPVDVPLSLHDVVADSLVAAICGTGPSVNERQVMAISRGSQIIACLGWSQPWPASSAKFWTEKVPSVHRIVRDALNLEMIRTQNQGLRWILHRSDRAVVAARIDGQLIGATVAATDLLKAIKFGRRHHARSDAPELPPSLIQALAQEVLRQVKLSDKVTAGFERVNECDSWLPVVGIEFFVETKSAAPLRAPALSTLTPAERDTLERMLAQKTNEQIADERGVKFATAKNQVSSVLGKLGVASRRDLFVPAICSPSMAVLGGSTAVAS